MDTSYAAVIRLLQDQLKQTRAAYYAGTPGVTYEDMAAAATRILTMQQSIERATGRPVRTKITKSAVANMLRRDL